MESKSDSKNGAPIIDGTIISEKLTAHIYRVGHKPCYMQLVGVESLKFLPVKPSNRGILYLMR